MTTSKYLKLSSCGIAEIPGGESATNRCVSCQSEPSQLVSDYLNSFSSHLSESTVHNRSAAIARYRPVGRPRLSWRWGGPDDQSARGASHVP